MPLPNLENEALKRIAESEGWEEVIRFFPEKITVVSQI